MIYDLIRSLDTPLLNVLLPRIFGVGLHLICLYAIIAGLWRERLIGVTYLAGYYALYGFELITTVHTVPYQLIVDALCLPSFIIVSWKSSHLWPKIALAAQTISLAVNVAALFYRADEYWSYTATENILGCVVLLSLLTGTVRAHVRRRQEKQSGVRLRRS